MTSTFKQKEVNVEFLSREEPDILMNKEFTIKRLEQIRYVFVVLQCWPG